MLAPLAFTTLSGPRYAGTGSCLPSVDACMRSCCQLCVHPILLWPVLTAPLFWLCSMAGRVCGPLPPLRSRVCLHSRHPSHLGKLCG